MTWLETEPRPPCCWSASSSSRPTFTSQRVCTPGIIFFFLSLYHLKGKNSLCNSQGNILCISNDKGGQLHKIQRKSYQKCIYMGFKPPPFSAATSYIGEKMNLISGGGGGGGGWPKCTIYTPDHLPSLCITDTYTILSSRWWFLIILCSITWYLFLLLSLSFSIFLYLSLSFSFFFPLSLLPISIFLPAPV